jgi:hypothetical protein
MEFYAELSIFLAELVVGKVEISQYLSHALPGLLLPDRERKSRKAAATASPKDGKSTSRGFPFL